MLDVRTPHRKIARRGLFVSEIVLRVGDVGAYGHGRAGRSGPRN